MHAQVQVQTFGFRAAKNCPFHVQSHQAFSALDAVDMLSAVGNSMLLT